jgi:hypothetical protein
MWPPYKKPNAFAVKDWIATAIALLALSVSATTAYFNVIRTTDDLSVVATNVPELEVLPTNVILLRPLEVTVVLINSGNRRAAISTFLVSFSQLRPDTRHIGSECLDESTQQDRTSIYKTGVDGLVVSDKEVRTQHFKLDGPRVISIAPFNRGRKTFSVVMCFVIDMVTPSDADISNYQIVREWQVTKDDSGGWYDVAMADKPDNRKALQIYHRVGTIW